MNDITKNVSRGTLEKLKTYLQLLLKWQKSINLVSRGTLQNAWQRHFLDSLQLIPYIQGKKILDVGSGAGFPGMVLAITGQFDVTCVDSDHRKMIFLSEVARLTDTKVALISDRIEKIPQAFFDTICARGFSSLVSLLEIMIMFTKNGTGVFLKGQKILEEISEAQKKFRFDYDIHKSKIDDTGCIIVIKNVEKIIHE